jgi:hypothetical protein
MTSLISKYQNYIYRIGRRQIIYLPNKKSQRIGRTEHSVENKSSKMKA